MSDSAAVPDVTALAREYLRMIQESRRASRHAEADEYERNLLALVEQTRQERDEAREEIRIREESQIPVIPRAAKERLDRAERERDEAQAHARELRRAAGPLARLPYPVSAYERTEWLTHQERLRAALVVAGRSPECGSIVDHIPDGFVCRLPRGHQGDHAYTEDPVAGRSPTDREQPRMHQALGTCWCGFMHSIPEAITLNGGDT